MTRAQQRLHHLMERMQQQGQMFGTQQDAGDRQSAGQRLDDAFRAQAQQVRDTVDPRQRHSPPLRQVPATANGQAIVATLHTRSR